MVDPRASGLVDDWRTVIQSPYGTVQPRSVTLNLRTPTHPEPPRSAPASMASVWASSDLRVSHLHSLPLAFYLTAFHLVRGRFTPNVPPPENPERGQSLPWTQGSPRAHSARLPQRVHPLCDETGRKARDALDEPRCGFNSENV